VIGCSCPPLARVPTDFPPLCSSEETGSTSSPQDWNRGGRGVRSPADGLARPLDER
jgi:hypothetical protein